MKAIILAAGEGSRLRPFTHTIPKPLIKIFGKSILEHTLESIVPYVSEIIIIVKYKEELIKETLWMHYKNIPLTYITQWDEPGTGAALKNVVSNEDVFILYGDSIIDASDVKMILESEKYWVLAKKVDDPSKYWIFQVNADQKILSVVEKPQEYIGNLANLWWFKMKNEILKIVQNLPLSPRWEYELTDALNTYIKNHDFYAFEIQNEYIDVWYPWDILQANSSFLNALTRTEIQWEIEEWVTIKGNIILEDGAILKSGTYIEWNVYIGKWSIIGPNTYLRGNTIIWEHSKIGNAVEIKNSTIWDHTNVAHLSYIWDSIIGNHVNIWWGMITANVRHDKANVKVMIKEKLIDTGLRKFWVIIWDHTKTWIKTLTYPGRIIPHNSFTLPWEIIQ